MSDNKCEEKMLNTIVEELNRLYGKYNDLHYEDVCAELKNMMAHIEQLKNDDEKVYLDEDEYVRKLCMSDLYDGNTSNS